MPAVEENWDVALFSKKQIELRRNVYEEKDTKSGMKKNRWKRWVSFKRKSKIDIKKYSTGHYLRFKAHINHITSYEPYVPELKRYILTFKSFYVSKAITKLSEYRYGQNQTTFVSIHVRLTDYHTVLQGLPIISEQYLSRAMEYFNKKYTVSYTQHY